MQSIVAPRQIVIHSVRMKCRIMRKLWTFVNSPLVAVLIGVVALVGTTYMIVSNLSVWSLFSRDDQRRADALSRMEIRTMEMTTNMNGRIDRCVGTLRNNSSYIVSDIDIALCLFDATNHLSDVVRQRVVTVGLMAPGKEAHFSVPVLKDNGEAAWPADWRTTDGRIELRFIDLRASEKKDP